MPERLVYIALRFSWVESPTTAADSLRLAHIRPKEAQVQQGNRISGRAGRPSRTRSRRGRGKRLAGTSNSPAAVHASPPRYRQLLREYDSAIMMYKEAPRGQPLDLHPGKVMANALDQRCKMLYVVSSTEHNDV